MDVGKAVVAADRACDGAPAQNAAGAQTQDRVSRLRALLIFAVVVPIVLLAGQAAFLWAHVWTEAEKELSRTADAAAEHSLRVLETHRIALTNVNDMLRGLSDEDIRRRERDLHDHLRRLVSELPLVQTVAVNDRHGGVLLTANVYPVPRDVNVSDREWIRDLGADGAPKMHVSRVYVGRLDRFLFFAVSRRRTETGNGLSAAAFDGAINISVQPNEFAAGFSQLTDVTDDVIAMVRADGQILSRRPGFAAPLPPITHPGGFPAAAASGLDRGLYRGSWLIDDGKERLVAFRKVRGYAVYAVVAREVGAISGRWTESIVTPIAVGVPVIGILGLLALFAYRRAQYAQIVHASLIAETARRAAADAARAAEARFHAIFQANPNGVLAADRSGTIRLANPQLEKLFGFQPGELVGRPVDLLVPARYRDHHAGLRAGFAKQPSTRPMGAALELYGLRKNGSEFPVEIGLSAFALEGEEVALAIIVDITGRRRAEEREKLLVGELQHRTKNLFAVVRALAQRGLRGNAALDDLRQAFVGRLDALARADQRLTNFAGKTTTLDEVVSAETGPFGDRVKVEGPEIILKPRAAQDFGLALHELVTNAAKYGALSASGGTVSIRWIVAMDGAGSALKFRWQERGGPFVAPPGRLGFGTSLLKAALGAGRIEYAAEGLNFDVEVSLAEIGIVGSQPPA